MTNSQDLQDNVIRTNRFSSMNSTTSSQEVEEPSDKYLQHVSAEINTACMEGFYVHMLAPSFEIDIQDIQVDEAGNHQIDAKVKWRLNYEIVPLEERKFLSVDHRESFGSQSPTD